MENLDNILLEFENIKEQYFQRKVFHSIIFLGILQNICIILIFLIPILSYLPGSSFLSVIAMLSPLVISRLIPVFGLIQFVRKQKVGWSIMLILSVLDTLQRIPKNLSALDISSLDFSYKIIIATSLFLLFVSGILTYLLTMKNVRDMFNISISRLVFAIVIGVALFVLIQFLLLPLLANMYSYN